MRWLVWLFGVMLAWILYEVTETLVARRTDDTVMPMVVALAVSIVVAGIVVWAVKRRMPGGAADGRGTDSRSRDDKYRRR